MPFRQQWSVRRSSRPATCERRRRARRRRGRERGRSRGRRTARASCPKRRTHRAHRRQGTGAGVPGSGEARARLEQRRALVERRALRAAGRRTVELRACETHAARPPRARRRAASTGSRASSARSARQPTTSASSATRCSTSSCSASGPTATSRRCSRMRRHCRRSEDASYLRSLGSSRSSIASRSPSRR